MAAGSSTPAEPAPAAAADATPARPPVHVLVIGGGFAGATLAVKLAANQAIDVTLVNRTRFFEVSFANARSIVEPSIADAAVIPFDQAMKPHGLFLCGEVVDLTDSAATLQDGRQLPFDYCAVATGSNYAVGKASGGADSAEARRAEVQALADRVKAAASVLIVGGGPLGVELAGEILTDLPGVQVTLVHSGASLLPTLPARLGTAARAWLLSKGCQVVLDDRVDVPADAVGGPFRGVSRNGVQLACDVVLTATGISLNSAFMRAHLSDALDAAGRIKVDKHLRVHNHPTLFALGDITDVREEKLAFLAAQQAHVVAASLATLAAASGGSSAAQAAAARRLSTWRPSNGLRVMLVTLGRNYGVGRIGWLTLTGWVPTWLKSRNVAGFVGKYRAALLLERRPPAQG